MKSIKFDLWYEDMKLRKYNFKTARKARKENKKMGKTEVTPTAKTRKVYEKTRTEHYKDIVIAVLITGVLAFMLGSSYQTKQQTHVSQAVQAVQVKK